MIHTGLRLSDALRLTYEDCRRGWKLESKNKHVLDIFYDPGHGNGLVIESPRGGPYHRTTMEKAFHNAALAAGIARPFNAHSARKMWAMQLLKDTNNLDFVKDTLGHRFLSTTLLYLFGHDHIDRKGDLQHATYN